MIKCIWKFDRSEGKSEVWDSAATIFDLSPILCFHFVVCEGKNLGNTSTSTHRLPFDIHFPRNNRYRVFQIIRCSAKQATSRRRSIKMGKKRSKISARGPQLSCLIWQEVHLSFSISSRNVCKVKSLSIPLSPATSPPRSRSPR